MPAGLVGKGVFQSTGNLLGRPAGFEFVAHNGKERRFGGELARAGRVRQRIGTALSFDRIVGLGTLSDITI